MPGRVKENDCLSLKVSFCQARFLAGTVVINLIGASGCAECPFRSRSGHSAHPLALGTPATGVTWRPCDYATVITNLIGASEMCTCSARVSSTV